MADEMNPRSLHFQLSHLTDLYQKLPRHMPDDLQAMRNALALLRSFDLRTIEYPLPGFYERAAKLRWALPSGAFVEGFGTPAALMVEQSLQ